MAMAMAVAAVEPHRLRRHSWRNPSAARRHRRLRPRPPL